MPTRAEPKTLLHSFQHWEQATPNVVYMTQPFPDGHIEDYSWRQTGDQARRVAAYLKSLNLPPHSNIALLGRNSAHWIMADLAIWMAGHVTVPLYPTLNAEGARFILQHAEAKLLFIGKMDGMADSWNEVRNGIPDGLPLIGLPMSPRLDVPQWNDIIKNTEPLQQLADPEPGDLATIVYTSGSTGQPKGVMHSHASMLSLPKVMAGEANLNPSDRLLSYLPLAHVGERACLECNSFYNGFRVYFANSLETFAQDLKRARPTVFGSVPRLWTKFYLAINEKLPPKRQRILFALPLIGRKIKKKILYEMGLDQVRMTSSGAAPLPPNIIDWYQELGLEILEIYGMTENFALSHTVRPGQVRAGYVGTPQPGVECRIAENGEVLVKSPGQMMGYYKMPEKTAEDMTPDGFFRTGDRGEIDELGRLCITGRVKELFKTSKGKYVAPVPVENKLNNHPMVEVVCVTGPGEPQPFALLMLSLDAQAALEKGRVSRDELTAQLKSLLEQVNATLEDHEKLDYVVVVRDQWTIENGFLTPTLKIKRNFVEDRYLARAGEWVRARQPVVWE